MSFLRDNYFSSFLPMAFLKIEAKVCPDFDAFLKQVDENLATYQRPLFVRLLPEMQSTSTFKQRKVDFVKDGFDPRKISDKLYWYNLQSKCYEPLDAHAFNIIVNGRSRL